MNATAAVTDWVHARADEMADLLMRLVAVDTENPPGRGLDECAAVLAEAMSGLGLSPEVIDVEDPADGRRADHGRGTADMKGGLVSMLYAAAAARDLGLLSDRRIAFHLVCDEETGSTLGSGNLRALDMIDPSAVAMLTPEPSNGVIWHANRGAITVRVTVAGQEAHVALRHEGDNAFTRLLDIARSLTVFPGELLGGLALQP